MGHRYSRVPKNYWIVFETEQHIRYGQQRRKGSARRNRDTKSGGKKRNNTNPAVDKAKIRISSDLPNAERFQANRTSWSSLANSLLISRNKLDGA